MGSHTPIGVMRWMSTLGAMKAEGTRVLRTCPACGCHGHVDVDHMTELLGGGDMTLWDCRPPCPLCGKLMHHMASPGPGSIFRPLLSAQPDPECLPPEAWLPGWLGRR
ncbi:MAG: hypothetical protein JWQ97_1002 [Phenylobacterium sp.]|nr:hypothetical protein [Phenylobacterium sp.]